MTKDEWYWQLFERLDNSKFRSSFHLKQKLRAITIFEFSLFESKKKAQKGEIIHGFIGCRCTEWYRGRTLI